jgi:CopG family transcriptional regulator / antitoxin EndoAI
MAKRINIILPEKTVSVLDRVTTKGNRSRFIDRAVLHYVETNGRQNLREQLKAGYRANAARDLETAAAWFPLEEEARETFEKTARKPARRRVETKRS